MKNGSRWMLAFASVFVFAASLPGADIARFSAEFESGPVWQTRNDVQIPNSTGTRFSLKDIQGSGPFPSFRATVAYAFTPRNELVFVAAPLTITSDGELTEPVSFAGQSFAPGAGVRARYEFNSYRVTYRYRIYDGERWTWKIGATGKIRDAKIELRDATTRAFDDDLGFVPLFHIDGERRMGRNWRFNLNMDGAAAPQGRAFDVALKLKYDFSKNFTAAAGCRMLEGGADVDRVYTFAWLHYAVASVAVRI